MQERPYIRAVKLKAPESLDWASYPYVIPAVNDLEKIEFHPEVTFFVGENGAGKSTILEALALALGFSEEGGTRNVQLNTATTSSRLYQSLRTIKSYKKPQDYYFLRAESFYNVATYMKEVDYLAGYGGDIHGRSHGEAFLKLLTMKLKGNGLYLLDEPEAALSPTMLMTTLSVLSRLCQAQSQFIIATHSPILLAYPSAKIYHFSETGIREICYEETEHFRVTRDFLNNYQKRVAQILEQE
ncbi:AAA family ATPase [Acinetobacter sp. A47]|uniref:AAA family ATPase n=1 Tax=Acinetobacter sp. A47 TaxID=1561217 RepID=UPI00057186DE|nr:AAA family ATPase [Acinetobacter sp. A47]